MKHSLVAIILALAVCICATTPAAQQEPAGESKPAKTDSSVTLGKGLDEGLSDHFRRSALQPVSGTELSLQRSFRLSGFKQVQMSQFECTVKGADIGITMGLFAGAAGMTMGLLDEDDAWYIAGAAALVGAFFGGTSGAKDPKFNMRLSWDPERETR
jgi:hypothetical protein